MRLKNILGKISLTLASCLFALLLCEGILRIYNPVKIRVAGDHVKLYRNYERVLSLGPEAEAVGLDPEITYSFNDLGFRGNYSEMDDGDSYRIFTVGGSTTECILIDDKKTWPFSMESLLQTENENVRVQNAGISGTSALVHQILLEEHLLELNPQMIIYLVGINDLFLAKYSPESTIEKLNKQFVLRSLSQKSRLLSLALTIYRSSKAKEISPNSLDYVEPGELSASELQTRHQVHRENQETYKKRLENLIETTRKNGIVPVLVTQPYRGNCLKHICAGLDLYNKTTLELGEQNKVLAIDLATELGNGEEYFFDAIHFNNKGAKRVAEIIQQSIRSSIPQPSEIEI